MKIKAINPIDTTTNHWQNSNLLLQKFPAEEFTATVNLSMKCAYERAGLIIFGTDYAFIGVEMRECNSYLIYSIVKNADKGTPEKILYKQETILHPSILRVRVDKNAVCTFSYSLDGGKSFTAMKEKFIAKPGKWTGAKVGIFTDQQVLTKSNGEIFVDWFRIEK